MGDEIRKVTELIIRERKNAEIKYPPPIISYAQNGEDILLNRAFMGKKNGFYIDVGAGKPSDDSVTKVFYDLGWRGINIEPNPCNFVLLEEERMEDTNLPFGIASKPETKTFYILKTDNSWGKSSFDKQCIKGLPDDLYDKKEVETKQLSDVISEYSSNKVIDFLKVDVEGSEYDVLKTLNFDINRPRVIILESVHPGTTKPVGDSCRKLVEKNGYIHALFDGLNDYYVSDDEVFIFNQFGAMVNLFDGVNNRISVEEIRNQNKELAKNVEELNLNTRKLQSKVDKNIKIISSLKSDVQSLKNKVNSHIQNVARLRKSLYNSKFTKHLYRAWRVLLNDPRYTIDSSLVPRQSPQVTFATHAIRALSSLFRMSAKPWHTHLYRCWRNFIGDPGYRKIQNLSKKKVYYKKLQTTESNNFSKINLDKNRNLDQPLLSICISTYNRSSWLNSSLNRLLSLIASYGHLIELVVCDNASTDETKDIIEKLHINNNFIYKINKENVGMLGNLAVTSNLATGKFVWIIGDDDHIHDECLEHLLKVILFYDDIDFIYTNYTFTHLNDPSNEFQIISESQQYISPVSKSRYVAKLSEVAANTPNFFTAIYCCIFRNEHAKKCYNQNTSGRPFSTLLTCVPTTNYVLDNLLDKPAYWYGSPAILINMNVSWLEHADLWVLERFPEIYQRFQQKSVSISRIDQYRKESINGVIDHLSRYLERKSKNFEIINLNTLYSSYYHLEEFQNVIPKIRSILKKNSDSHNILLDNDGLVQQTPISVQGPFVGSYSLAIVNRSVAHNFHSSGYDIDISPSPTEGANFNIDAHQIDELTYSLYLKSTLSSRSNIRRISLRNTFPPVVDEMNGLLNIYHSFGWEESLIPNLFVNNLNSIDAVTVMSRYVKKSLQDSGVVVPIYVTGLGIDKIYIPDANESSKNTFSFLHISSCFERKGIDVLLNSYFDTFNANDKVRLVIKTFPNPHNKVEALLASLKDRYSHPPSVVLINEDWEDSSKLLQLYYDCDVLVMPSRGEGFCLPIGEALMCGKPVIATGWGGQMDMLNHDYPWLIDFTFKRSSSHLSEGDANWVEPSPRSLSSLLQTSFCSTKEYRDEICSEWRTRLLTNFTWENVINNIKNSLRNIDEQKIACKTYSKTKERVAFLTTWQQKCGISEYSRNLLTAFSNLDTIVYPYNSIENLPDHPDCKVFEDKWYDNDTISGLRIDCFRMCDLIVIQHQPSFFESEDFVEALKVFIKERKKIFIIIHNVMNFIEKYSLESFPVLKSKRIKYFVHSINDLNLIKESLQPILLNTTQFSHGIIDCINHTAPDKQSKAPFLTLSSFGFLLPNKGIHHLIEAIAILNGRGINVRLKLYTSILDHRSSEYYERCMTLIKELNVHDIVEFSTDYLEINDVIRNLSETDLIVLPYTDSTESCSGALRTCFSARRPILCSDLTIFQEANHMVYTFESSNSKSIADKVEDFANGIFSFGDKLKNLNTYIESNSWQKVGQKFQNIILQE